MPLEAHPVYAALPEEARTILDRTATFRTLDAWEEAPERRLFFVTEGVLGQFSGSAEVCVGLVAPGAVFGWEYGVFGVTPSRAAAVTPCGGYSAPVAPVIDALGTNWIYRFLATHSLFRLRNLQAEAACNARHSALQRLAKWTLRLHGANLRGHGVCITQGSLARLLGLQRTSVNAVCQKLQAADCIRVRRGQLVVDDVEGLARASCDCDVQAYLAMDEAEPIVRQERLSMLET